jgi:hypothetical protein
MGFFGDLLGGLTGVQTSNPLANSFQSGMNEVGGSLAGSNAAINQAGNNVTTATGNANNQLQTYLNQQLGNLNPGIESGQQGNTSLQQYAASNPQFNFQPTQQQLASTPGYQFQLNQGENAITNSAAAQGLSQGGSTLAALTQYGQGLAGTYYQNAFNNAQSQFQTNQNTTLSNLQALIGAGNTANSQSLGATVGLGAPQASNTIGAANTNAGLQQYLGGLNLQGNTTIAGLNVGQGEAKEAQQLGNSAALGSDITSLVAGFGGF